MRNGDAATARRRLAAEGAELDEIDSSGACRVTVASGDPRAPPGGRPDARGAAAPPGGRCAGAGRRDGGDSPGRGEEREVVSVRNDVIAGVVSGGGGVSEFWRGLFSLNLPTIHKGSPPRCSGLVA